MGADVAGVLIVDLDGVLRHWDRSVVAKAEERNGLPAGCIEGAAFADPLLKAALTGRVKDEQWRHSVAEVLAERHGEPARRAVRQWSEACGTVDPEVLGLLREARRTRRIALLTNATSRLPHDLDRLELTGEFDEVFNSSTLGVAKPDERIFRAVLAALGRAPSDCLFVDDTAAHVVAARGLGIIAHHFRTAPELAKLLGGS